MGYCSATAKSPIFGTQSSNGRGLSCFEWPNKAARDAAMMRMMDDPRMDPSVPGKPPMPSTANAMVFGGFEQVVDVKA